MRDVSDPIILRKTSKKYGWKEGKFHTIRKTTPCEYTDTRFSNSARNFLKEYNKWIAAPSINFDMLLANETGLWKKPKFQQYEREDFYAYIYTYYHNRSLRRITHSTNANYQSTVRHLLIVYIADFVVVAVVV
ncbi:MAG: hypothetical protein AB7L92_02590 [Alphaproteobacteria bacterium]